MAKEFIDVTHQGSVLIITLNDSRTRNALGKKMFDEISEELTRFESDQSLRALVLTGKDPAFCSGVNLGEISKWSNVEQKEYPSEVSRLTPWERMETGLIETGEDMGPESLRYLPLRIFNLQKPTIAALNGYAMGIGMGLALSCDIRIASTETILSEAFVKSGLIPADGSCWQLPRMIGLSNTLLLQYTGDSIDADECYRLGIVNKVVPHDQLLNYSLELAQRLAKGPTYAISLTKWLVHKSLEVDFEQSLSLAGSAQEIAMKTKDHKEGLRAFAEKRTPKFEGR